MTQDSAWAVQAAVYAALCAHPPLTAQLAAGANSVFDHVPQGAAFPYIVLGDMQAAPLETQGGGGYDITLDVLAFSKGAGMKEVKNVMSAVFDALHGHPPAAAGQTVVLCELAQAEAALLQDGETRRGRQRFRIVTEPL